eukprot:6184485-Pleurochrysis_carterae.AAC.2
MGVAEHFHQHIARCNASQWSFPSAGGNRDFYVLESYAKHEARGFARSAAKAKCCLSIGGA